MLGAIGTYAGLRIVEDMNLYDTIEDWSGVRSPGRAARRRKMGHPQRIVYRRVAKPEAFQIGNAIHMHPDTARKFREMVRQRNGDT